METYEGCTVDRALYLPMSMEIDIGGEIYEFEEFGCPICEDGTYFTYRIMKEGDDGKPHRRVLNEDDKEIHIEFGCFGTCHEVDDHCEWCAFNDEEELFCTWCTDSLMVAVDGSGCVPYIANCDVEYQPDDLEIEEGEYVCPNCDEGWEWTGMKCERCDPKCATCSEGSCDTCAKGYFFSPDRSECVLPIQKCKIDVEDQPQGLGVDGSDWVCDECIDGYYPDESHCVKCDPSLGCITCSSRTECDTCDPEYVL